MTNTAWGFARITPSCSEAGAGSRRVREVIGDHQDDNSSGGVLAVSDEPHNLTNTPAFLNNPRVIAITIQVRAASDNFPYGSADYTIVTSGQQTGIQLVLGNMNVALHGSAVLVNYQSASLYNASFESFNGSARSGWICSINSGFTAG